MNIRYLTTTHPQATFWKERRSVVLTEQTILDFRKALKEYPHMTASEVIDFLEDSVEKAYNN